MNSKKIEEEKVTIKSCKKCLKLACLQQRRCFVTKILTKFKLLAKINKIQINNNKKFNKILNKRYLLKII